MSSEGRAFTCEQNNMTEIRKGLDFFDNSKIELEAYEKTSYTIEVRNMTA